VHIALDAMGGDHGPEELITGALLAVEQAELHVTLVGDEVLLGRLSASLPLAIQPPHASGSFIPPKL